MRNPSQPPVTLEALHRGVIESREAEVVILGGGPAGVTIALALNAEGHSVIVLERSRARFPRQGEALPPEIRQPLDALGVWERFLEDAPLPSPGIVSVWGSSRAKEFDFIFHPGGSGWLVDRVRFDARLAQVASIRGVEILSPATLVGWKRGPARSWILRATLGDRALECKAHVLVDATGRSSSPIRQLGGKRIVHDRLVGLVGLVKADSADDHRTLVEATENGWWYSCVLPQGHMVAVFLIDADLIARAANSRHRVWSDCLSQAPHTRYRLGSRVPEFNPEIVVASTSRLSNIAGDGRLAVGDAATTIDPLSGQGVLRAMNTGLAAAHAIDLYLGGDQNALGEYATRVEAYFAAELRSRAAYYSAERRWPNSLFWRRRHATLSLSPA